MAGLTIGDLAIRTGLAVSAIRFYETHGIVHPVRNAGGHRRYGNHDLRRLSYAMIAQRLGFVLGDIAAQMTHLSDNKAPSKSDWTRVSTQMRQDIDDRIAQLETRATGWMAVSAAAV
jgi:MerR family redox-sensitive transcriptional activator SoxR